MRILRFLGKSVLGLLIVLLALILLLHTPFVQNYISKKIPGFLSEQLGAKVELQQLRFSIFGCAELQGLKIWDPNDEMILSVDSFDLTTNFLDILSGDFHLKKVKLNGVSGHLTQDQSEELNIQFIIDAFSNTSKSDEPSAPFYLKCDSLILEYCDFSFNSLSNEMKVVSQLKHFIGTHILFASDPLLIQMDTVIVEQQQLNVFSKTIQEAVENLEVNEKANTMSLDLDLGIGFTINSVTLKENSFSFHTDTIITTPKFDPNHVEAQQVNLKVTNLLLLQDTLNFDLLALSVQLPGFVLNNSSAQVVMDHQRFGVTSLVLDAANSHINADAHMAYENETASNPSFALKTAGHFTIKDFSYFMPDTLEEMIGHLSKVTYAIDAKSLSPGKERIELDLQTSNSHLSMAGEVSNLMEPEEIAWDKLVVQSSIGNDFKRLLQSIAGQSELPPGNIGLQMTSSGNRKSVNIDGGIKSTWGDVKLKGQLKPTSAGMDIDMEVLGSNLLLGEYLKYPWLGPASLNVSAVGSVGDVQNFKVDGLVSSIEVSGKAIHQIKVAAHLLQDSLITSVVVNDSNYRSEIFLAGHLNTPMAFSSQFRLDSFKLDHLFSMDSMLVVSGTFTGDIVIDQSDIHADINGNNLFVSRTDANYVLDSLSGSVKLTADSSYFLYKADDGQMELYANFDLREMEAVFDIVSNQILYRKDYTFAIPGARAFKLNANLKDPGIFQLAGVNINSNSPLQLKLAWEEIDQSVNIDATTGKLSAFGVSFDTLIVAVHAAGEKVNSSISAEDLFYNDFKLGDLNFDLRTKADTSASNFRLMLDSLVFLNLDSRIVRRDEGIVIYLGELVFYDKKYQVSANEPVFVSKENVEVNGLTIIRDDIEVSLNGDLNAFNLDLNNLDLERLNPILFPDAPVINSGHLNGSLTFIRDQHLDLVANVSNLVLLNTNPLTIEVRAETKNDQVPFDFLMTNGGSSITVKGDYAIKQNELKASALMDIDSLEMFRIFYGNYLDDLTGAMKGKAKVSGPIEKPIFEGSVLLRDFNFTTLNPKLSFMIKEDSIHFNNKGLKLNDFTVFDNLNNPLQVSGHITNEDYKSVSYDLNIKTDNYALINRPVSTGEYLNGLLVMGSDINLKGNKKDTYVKAEIIIKDTTKMVLTLPDRQNQMLNTEGIIQFVDPSLLFDSTVQVQNRSVYDSLISSLPEFSLTSRITIEEDAGLIIHIDPQSGDYFKINGKAVLNLSYDRTGNPILDGTYEVANGVYSLSFYDLVKKDFKLVEGSSISWSGAPEDGALDIKAAYSIKSNSIGLVGEEVSENEKSVYKKSLDYALGIVIRGSISKPEISFSLDLPEADKITYPALANKLNRLKQPEFQSELNKQVFGLLVLGSFLPESSEGDGGQSDIATMALYNSVNSVLAAQLNKFAGQYIKGVNIDVGFQSYNDAAANGGKTQTSMDFHVSKSVLNDRLVFEIGGDFDIGADQSGANQGKSYRGDMAIIYKLSENGDKRLKLFNNESYDIIYQEIRNTGISLIFIREFNKGEIKEKKNK